MYIVRFQIGGGGGSGGGDGGVVAVDALEQQLVRDLQEGEEYEDS